jgi:hypothetical protein
MRAIIKDIEPSLSRTAEAGDSAVKKLKQVVWRRKNNA